MQALFNPKAIFIFLSSIFRYQRFMSFYKALQLYQRFSFCMMFGLHFDNVSVPMNSVAFLSQRTFVW